MVAASAGGELVIYRRLSAFLIDMAALRLGQHAHPEKIQVCNEFYQHQLRRGEAVAIVLKRHGLSAACDDGNYLFGGTALPMQNHNTNFLLYAKYG